MHIKRKVLVLWERKISLNVYNFFFLGGGGGGGEGGGRGEKLDL